MTPNTIPPNASNSSISNIKAFANDRRKIRPLKTDDFYDLLLCQSCPMVSYAAGHASLASSILHILCLRAKPEMGIIDARAIIASMQNALSFWDSPMFQHKGKVMRHDRRAMHAKLSIAIGIHSCHPWPAGIRPTSLVNFRPETSQGFCFRGPLASLRTIFARIPRFRRKECATGSAGHKNVWSAMLSPKVRIASPITEDACKSFESIRIAKDCLATKSTRDFNTIGSHRHLSTGER